MAAVELKRPVRRRLRAAYHKRPWFIEITPEGVLSIWPRRWRREEISVEGVYVYAVRLRLAAEKLKREKARKEKRDARRAQQGA